MTSQTLKRAFCVLAAVSVFLLSLGLVSAAHAEAAFSVVLTRITQDASGVTVVGSVTHAGDPVEAVEVVLWRDGPSLVTPTDLQSVLKTDATRTFTALHSESGKQTLTTENIVSGAWAFTLHVTWEQLGVSGKGVYFAGVDVRLPGADAAAQPLARERTLLTLGEAATTHSATVVELSSTPSLLHGSVFLDDHLASEFTDRLGSLVALAQAGNVSWAIDPLLHHEATVMAGGYEVLVEGQRVPGEGSQSARDWLAKVNALPKSTGYRLPWANPDLGLVAGLSEEEVNQVLPFDALSALPPSVASLPLLVRARDGSGDSSWLDIVETLNPAVVLASASTSGTLDSGILIPSPAPWGGLDGSDSASQMAAMRAAEDSIYGPKLARIVDNPDQAQVLPALATPALLSDLTSSVDQPFEASALTEPTKSVLTRQSVDAAAHMGGTVAAYAVLTNSESAVRELVASQRLAALSQNWEGDSASLAYTDAVARWVGTLPGAVTLSATSNVTLTSRTASFPVTITNKSPLAVYVRVASVSSSPLVMSVPSTEMQRVNPGDSIAAVLTPRVSRDGDAEVFFWLETSNGTRVSAPTTTHISATQTAWLSWTIIGGAAILLVVGTGMRVRAVAKAKGHS